MQPTSSPVDLNVIISLMSKMSAPRARSERRVILVVLGLFLFTVPGLFALVGEQILFNPQVYKEALADLDFYERFPQILGETLAGSGDLLLPGVGANLLGAMNANNYQEIIRLLFPPDWVMAQAESLIDQFWAYYNFETPELHLIVDFSAVKARLQSERDLQVVQTIVQGLPVCTQQDLLNFGLLALQGKLDQAPLCRPPDQFIGVANGVVRELLRGAGSLAPGQVDLAVTLRLPVLLRAGRGAGAAGLTFQVYRAFRIIGPWLPLGSLLCLIGIIAWGRKTVLGALFWSGMGLLLSGFVALVTALLLVLWSNQIAPFLVARIFFSDLAVFDLLVRLVQAVSNRYLLWVGGVSLAMTLVGAALIAGAYFKSRTDSAVQPPEASRTPF